MNGTEKPMGVAIIICDRVITETGTNNKTIVSTFNSIHAAKFPCIHQRMAVFVALTNASGVKEVNLVLTHEGKTIIKFGGKVMFSGPNAVVELIFNLKGVPFPDPGTYCFEVHAGGDYIFESRFNLTKTEGGL